MRARSVNTFVPSDQFGALVAHLEAVTIPTARGQPGYRGAVVTGERHSGHIIITTFWEHHAARESRSQHVSLMRQLDEAVRFIGTRTTYETFEVLLAVWPEDQPPASDQGAVGTGMT